MADHIFELRAPTQCAFWKNPEQLRGNGVALLERVEVFVDESHFMRRLHKCRECGQLYFYEFTEEIDHAHGEDPQYRKYIPVENAEQIETLRASSASELLRYFPRLQSDWSKDVERPVIRWVTSG